MPSAWPSALDLFERMLDGRDYLMGDEVSAADFAAFPFLKYAPDPELPDDDELFHRVLDDHQQLGDDHPRLTAWIERIDALPRATERRFPPSLGDRSAGAAPGRGRLRRRTTTEGAEIPGGADPEAAQVIDEWSTALREGDVEAAAEYFELPSVAQNGTPPLELESREDVIAFNEALPCGAELVRAEEQGASSSPPSS